MAVWRVTRAPKWLERLRAIIVATEAPHNIDTLWDHYRHHCAPMYYISLWAALVGVIDYKITDADGDSAENVVNINVIEPPGGMS